jgi:hypothetical protein
MRKMKRISMAGADVAVTDAEVADLVLEYAKHLGRVDTTDTVTLPVAQNDRAAEASLLLGPASQIALMENEDLDLGAVRLPGVEEVAADLRARIEALTRPPAHTPVYDDADETADFADPDDL